MVSHLSLSISLISVPRSLAGIIGKIIDQNQTPAKLMRKGIKIIDLTDEGKSLLQELKSRISLDREVFIAKCNTPEICDDHSFHLANPASFSPAIILMIADEIDKTFDLNHCDHYAFRLKLLLRLVLIKQRSYFGQPEHLYCCIALMGIAASRFSQARLAPLWGLAAGQWFGNYIAGKLSKSRQEQAQIEACRSLKEDELPSQNALQNLSSAYANPKESLSLIPFDMWEKKGFSHWQLVNLAIRAQKENAEQLEKELLLADHSAVESKSESSAESLSDIARSTHSEKEPFLKDQNFSETQSESSTKTLSGMSEFSFEEIFSPN